MDVCVGHLGRKLDLMTIVIFQNICHLQSVVIGATTEVAAGLIIAQLFRKIRQL